MGFLWKKTDPISERGRTLKVEIALLEEQIQRLNADLEQSKAQPKLRSTALPHSQTQTVSPNSAAPVFEKVDHGRIHTLVDAQNSPAHLNELGARQYDLLAVWQRFKSLFHSPPPNNPKLINLLAAGNFHGLRPLRYEKRVARNRVIALMAFLLLVLYCFVTIVVKHR